MKRNVLVIGTTATETPFLSEAELPESAKLSNAPQDLTEEGGSEDAALARAIEESVRDQRKKKGGSSSPSSPSMTNKKSRKD